MFKELLMHYLMIINGKLLLNNYKLNIYQKDKKVHKIKTSKL